ncbi:hypothetical protein B296_00046552, partial [Ensete ventricosum]
MLGTYRSNRGPVCLVKLGTLMYHVSVCLKKKREKEKKSIKIPCALLFTGSPTWSIARAIPSPRTGRRIEATSPTDRYVDHSIPLIGAVPRVTARNRKGEKGEEEGEPCVSIWHRPPSLNAANEEKPWRRCLLFNFSYVFSSSEATRRRGGGD